MNMRMSITVAKIVCLPLMMFFYLSSGFIVSEFLGQYGKLIALALFVLAAAAEFVFVPAAAREEKPVSELGRLLAALAAKGLVLAGFLLVLTDFEVVGSFRPSGFFLPLPVWFAVLALFVMVARDYVFAAVRAMAAKASVKTEPDKYAKAKNIIQHIAILFLMVYAVAVANNFFGIDKIGIVVQVYEFASLFALALAVIICIVSAGDYLYRYRELYLGAREKKEWGE